MSIRTATSSISPRPSLPKAEPPRPECTSCVGHPDPATGVAPATGLAERAWPGWTGLPTWPDGHRPGTGDNAPSINLRACALVSGRAARERRIDRSSPRLAERPPAPHAGGDHFRAHSTVGSAVASRIALGKWRCQPDRDALIRASRPVPSCPVPRAPTTYRSCPPPSRPALAPRAPSPNFVPPSSDLTTLRAMGALRVLQTGVGRGGVRGS